MTVLVCEASVIAYVPLWQHVILPLLLPCGEPAPNHGVTASQDGVSLGRKPICDAHYAALKEQMGVGS